jgi:hypothetical protein
MDEECVECGESTDEFTFCECGGGPYCPDCWTDHKAVCKHAAEMEE